MSQVLTRFARAAGAYVPEATAVSILMLVLLAAIALGMGNSVATLGDAFYRGLWMLLPFSMQMALMLLLSAAISTTPTFRRTILALAQLPRSALQVLALATAITAALSYCFWALGLALGPLIAINFAGAAEKRGIRVDFPCLLACLFAAQSIWQFGLSSSAALLVASPGHFLESTTGIMPASTTIFSGAAILLCLTFPLFLVLLAKLIMPRDGEPLSAFPRAQALLDGDPTASALGRDQSSEVSGFSAWCEQTRVLCC
jgi:short-chain fatty acids transporter